MAQNLTNKNRLLEKYMQVVREDGLNTNKNVNVGINGVTANLWVSGNITTGGTLGGGAQTITSTSANALAVGPNGTTNPTFNVDASTASAATGLNIKGAAAAAGVALSVLSSGTNENLTIDSKGTGTITLNGTATGTVNIGTNLAVTGIIKGTSSSAQAFAVGLNGTTNPAILIDASTSSSATGVKVKSAAAAAGVAVSAISSGTNENLTIDAKGSGTLSLNVTATGNILTGAQLAVQTATAPPASGAATAGILMSSTAALGLFFGSGAPTFSAAQGALYMRTDGSSTSTRLYVNTTGSTTWTNVTTAA